MKKAKEHAAPIIAATDMHTASTLLSRSLIAVLTTEVAEMIGMRRVRTNVGVSNILKEQATKWMAVCRQVNAQSSIVGVDDKTAKELFSEQFEKIFPNLIDWFNSSVRPEL